MISYVLRLFGYLHISEIREILEEEASYYDKCPRYNPYKKNSSAWWQQTYEHLHIAQAIRDLKMTFHIKLPFFK